MKSFKINTKVHGQAKEIFDRFDRELLIKTTPPLVNLEVNRFDGTKIGDEAHVVCSIFGTYQYWINRVVDNQQKEGEVYFVDKAIEMPEPFTYWKHTHKITQVKDHTCLITDEIVYSTHNKILNLMIFPIIYFIFYYRRPIYMDTFSDD